VKKVLRSVLAVTAAASLLAPTVAVAADDLDPSRPTSTAERAGPPSMVAVLGDSISAGTGADGGGQGGLPGQERPENSWATGGSATLDSVWQRVNALPDHQAGRSNLSQNGHRATHILGQVQGSPADVDYILIQIGGNDLCRPTVDDMTPTETYRQQVDDALAWIAEHRPDALVQINAVPDIYRLWELRRTNFIAILFWASGIIPCQSLLASPTSTSDANMARRAQVRERGLEYNAALREVCDQYLRCRYDDDATWLFSNDPATFVNADISYQDHFHPSFSGQRKLAAVSWEAGFDFSDAAAPEVAITLDPAANEAGWNAADPVEVMVSATDDDEVAGIEVRVHGTDDGPGTWQPVFGDATTLTLEGEGVQHVEARAVDANGNVSASVVRAVRVDTTEPTITLDAGVDDGEDVVLGTEAVVTFDCDDALSGVASCEGTQASGTALDTSQVGLHTITVDAADVAGNASQVSLTYRVVYDVSAAADRIDTGEVIRINRNAVLPVRLSLADVDGVQATTGVATLVLEDAAGDRIDAGGLVYDPIADHYAGNVSLRQLGVRAGTYELIAELDDGTEFTVARLAVR
jgi:lysophospholipase L1-like esterase